MELFINIVVSCSVIGYCWTNILTDERQILDFIPQYYPSKLYKPLTCATCLSGWLCIIISIYWAYITLQYWLLLAPFFSMVFTKKILLYE